MLDEIEEIVVNADPDEGYQTFAFGDGKTDVEHRRTQRAMLGIAAIVSVSQAAEWLPLGDSRARRWLRSAGLIRTLDGKAVVVWGEVVESLRGVVAKVPSRQNGKRVAGVELDEVEAWLG